MGVLDNFKSIFGQPKQEQPQAMQPKKVLIVEDDKALADSLQARLQQDGHIILRAEDGESGLALVSKEKPDVVVLDLVMPVMSGNAMLHSLRKLPEFVNLPVIVLTNAGTVDNMRETKFYDRASDFLIKSNITLEQISLKVKQYLGQ